MEAATRESDERPPGFDTSLKGTPDQDWRRLLVASAPLNLTPGPILVVAPHPDDETLGAGGLLASHSDARIVSVTDGEAAESDNSKLDSRRRRELLRASRCLNPRMGVEHLALPDGEVAQHQDRLERLLRRHFAPGVTVVAPYENDGHADHDAVGRVCLGLARRYRLPLLRYLIWGWHQQTPSAFRAQQFVRWPLSVRAQHAKQRALSCFVSQLQGGERAVVPAHVLTYFRRPYEAFLR